MHYELGYRFPKHTETTSDFNTPYVDITPEALSSYPTMNELLKRLRQDFPQAEWRAVQCFNPTYHKEEIK
jgi:hypothetical protein